MSKNLVYVSVEVIGINEIRIEDANYTLREAKTEAGTRPLNPFQSKGTPEVGVMPGKYILTVELDGYEPYEKEIDLTRLAKNQKNIRIEVRLVPKNIRHYKIGRREFMFAAQEGKIGIIPSRNDAKTLRSLMNAIDQQVPDEISALADEKQDFPGRSLNQKRFRSLSIDEKKSKTSKTSKSSKTAARKFGGKKAKTISQIRSMPQVAAVGHILYQSEESVALLTPAANIVFRYDTPKEEVHRILTEAGAIGYELMVGTGFIYTAHFPDDLGLGLFDTLAELIEMEVIDDADPVIARTVVTEAEVPNDFLWPNTWSRNALTNTGEAWEDLRTQIGANSTYGASNIIIGVIDTGLLSAGGIPTHPSFQGTVAGSHATATTGIIVAPNQVLDVVSTVGIAMGMGLRLDIGRGQDIAKNLIAVNAGANQITVAPLWFDHPAGTIIRNNAGGATLTRTTSTTPATTVNVRVGAVGNFAVGHSITFGAEGGANTEHGVITAIAGNQLTVRGLVNGHAAGTPVQSGRKTYRLFDFNVGTFGPNNDNSNAEDHGLNCAGIAVGNGNNVHGSPGMAPNARVLGVHMGGGTTLQDGQVFQWTSGTLNYVSGGLPVNPQLILPGADILTVSLGMGKVFHNPPASPYLGPTFHGPINVDADTALRNITRRGRNSRGTLIFMSAGNDDRQQDQPRWSSHPNTFSCAATWMGRNNGIAGNPDFTKESKAYYSCYSNPASPGNTPKPVTWAGISGYSNIPKLPLPATHKPSDFNSPHNPPIAQWIVAPTWVGRGNMPARSVNVATLTAPSNPTMNSWLIRGIIAGATDIHVASTANLNAGDWVRIGGWGADFLVPPVYNYVQVAVVVNATRFNITAATALAADHPAVNLGAGAFNTVGATPAGNQVTINAAWPTNLPLGSLIRIGGITYMVTGLANNGGAVQCTVSPNIPVTGAGVAVNYLGRSGSTVAVGVTVFQVNSTAGFVAGSWALLGNPAPTNSSSGLIHSVISPTMVRISGPFYPMPIGARIHAGPNDFNNRMNGTSASTPYCAGIGALVLSAKPSLTWLEVRDLLSRSAFKVDVGNTGFAAEPGTGNVAQAQFNGYGPVGIGQWRNAGGLPIMLGANNIAPVGPASTLNALANQGDTTITVANGALFTKGQALQIGAGANRDYSTIKRIVGNVVTIEPLTLPHANGTAIQGGRTPVVSDWYGAGRLDPEEAVIAALAYTHNERDLMIRNYLGDNGTVATNPAVNPINSPDIFLRNANDIVGGAAIPYATAGPHQNPNNGLAVPIFEGTGNNDLLVRGFFTGAAAMVFVVEIDGNAPDTFQWSSDGGATFPTVNVPITPGINQALNNGVSIVFPADAGHALNDRWTINAAPTSLFYHVRLRNRGATLPSLDGSFLKFYIALTNGDAVGNGNTPFYFPQGWDDNHLITGNIATNNNESVTYMLPNPAATNPNNIGVLLPNDTPIIAPILPNNDTTFVVNWPVAQLPPASTNRKIYMLAEVLPHDGILSGISPDANNNVSYRQLLFAKVAYRNAGGTALGNPIFTNPTGVDATTAFTSNLNVEIGDIGAEGLKLILTRRLRGGATESVTWERIAGVWQFTGAAPAWAALNAPTISFGAVLAAGDQRAVTFSGTINHNRDHNQISLALQASGTNSTAVIFEDKQDFTVTDRGLVIRDHLEDVGIEITDTTAKAVHSPDIWISMTDDPVAPPPTFNEDGPHQNPGMAADRFCYIRVKNMGVFDNHLAADVKFYIALSDGADAAGIQTPFAHPANWLDTTPIANITTDAPNTYYIGSSPILAASIPLSNAADWQATDASAQVLKFTWNAADLPPVASANKIFLLAEIEPHDGTPIGNGAENNRNLSYREIMFAHANFDDGSGNPFPDPIFTDPRGNPVTQTFAAHLTVDIGTATSEHASIRLIRHLRTGTTEITVWHHDGANWVFEGGAPAWATLSPPVITGTANPAVGEQTTISFSGTFDHTRECNQVSLEIRAGGVNKLAAIFVQRNTLTITDRGLLVRDFLGDVGILPTVVATNPVNSPDIWVRHNDDPLLPPIFDIDAPHLNPNRTSDRWCFVRVKNMGVYDQHLAADIKFYIALSAGANGAGIDTPFLHPADWTDGTPASSLSSDAAGTYFLGSASITAADLTRSDANNWYATDHSVRVFKFKWDQGHIPPVATNRKIFLLTEITPHDGNLIGAGAEINRNLSYREIVFCAATFRDGSPAPLPDSIAVDNLGNEVTQNFAIDLSISTGTAAATDVKLRLTRQNDNGTEEEVIYEHDGSWQWTGGAPSWGTATPPTITNTANPATGNVTAITFSGSFAAAMQHANVRVEVIIESSVSSAIIAREWRDVAVNSAEELPIGNHPESEVYTPHSHAFADMDLLDLQPASLAYGPLAGDEANVFRLTSGFTAVGQTVKAYAITNSIVMLQRDANDAARVNLILKPFTQAGLEFTPVRYYVYRGLKLTDFLDSVVNQVEIRTATGASAFIARLYAIHNAMNDPGDPLLSNVLGFDTGNQPAANKITDVFFEGDGEIQLPFAARGMVLGEFETTSGNPFGLEIILDEGNYQPDFAYTRASSYVVDRSTMPAGFADRLAREEILNFIDPAAFYGMHVGGKVKIPAGDQETAADIVANVLAKFHTRNKLYLDIRNENGDSYNFYQNYHGANADTNFGMDLASDTSSTLSNYSVHAMNSWPVTILDAPVNTMDTLSDLYIALRLDDNKKPLLYIERGNITTKVKSDRFVRRQKLLFAGNVAVWTKAIGFRYHNTGPSGARIPIANVIKLHYTREIKASTSWPATVVPTETYLDNVFGPLNQAMPWNKANIRSSWISMQDKKYVDGKLKKLNYMAERGLSFQDFDLVDTDIGRVAFYAVADDYVFDRPRFKGSNGITGGVSTEGSFFQAANVFQGLTPRFFTIKDGGNDITVFKMEPNGANNIPPSSVLVLGISRKEYNDLNALPGFENGYDKNIVLEKIGGTLKYKKYKLKVSGLDPSGNHYTAAPASDIVVYGKNRYVFTSNDFAQEEPIPTTYVRNYEESFGLQDNDLGQTFSIISSSKSANTFTLTGTDAAEILSTRDEITVLNDPAPKNNRNYKIESITTSGGNTVVEVKPGIKTDSVGGDFEYHQKLLEDYCIDKDELGSLPGNPHEMWKLVEEFAKDVENADDAVDLALVVNEFGPKILKRGRAIANHNGYANADDRILYWARIKMTVILKSHPHLLGDFEAREELLDRFEKHSRGYNSVDFSSVTGSVKKVLITGFDPFQLSNNKLQSNPSGAAALALHGVTIVDGLSNPVAFIQSALLPVRYHDFEYNNGLGVVEDFYEKHINSQSQDPATNLNNFDPVNMIITVSQAGKRYFWIDRFASRYREELYTDNEGLHPDPFPELPTALKFLETTLPVSDIVTSPYVESPIATWDVAPSDFGVVYNQRFSYLDSDTNLHRYLPTNLNGVKKIEDPVKDAEIEKFSTDADENPVMDLGPGMAPPELANFDDIQERVGSGGNYLSNESFYRVSAMRAQYNSLMKTGHLHIPKLQGKEKLNDLSTEFFPIHKRFPKANTKALIERIYEIIKDANL